MNLFELSSIQSGRQLRKYKDSEEEDTLVKLNKSIRRNDSKVQILSINISSASSTRKSFQTYIDPKIDPTYQIMDLTYTFLMQDWNIYVIMTWLAIMLMLRYYTMGCLIYVVVKAPSMWQWVFVIFASRLIYFIAVIKVSLKIPQTKTQIILKNYWDSNQSQIHEIFAQVEVKKLFISFIRALIPAQLSFIYLNRKNRKKKIEIYSAINFIYCSIEALIYYPFFIIYCALINQDNQYALNIISPSFTIILASAGELLIVLLSSYLVVIGCIKKYGNFRNIYSQPTLTRNSSIF